jgi:hypothetical protein
MQCVNDWDFLSHRPRSWVGRRTPEERRGCCRWVLDIGGRDLKRPRDPARVPLLCVRSCIRTVEATFPSIWRADASQNPACAAPTLGNLSGGSAEGPKRDGGMSRQAERHAQNDEPDGHPRISSALLPRWTAATASACRFRAPRRYPTRSGPVGCFSRPPREVVSSRFVAAQRTSIPLVI